MYKNARKKTLGDFPDFSSYRDHMESAFPDIAKAPGSTYMFLKSDDHDEHFSKLQISEEIEFEYFLMNLNNGTMRISFQEDTSYSNEGGSHPGGYTYDFIVDTEEMHIINMEVTNHN
jgi:hypothetical protein